MERIVQEMRETAARLQQMADTYIEAKRGHRSVDVANREKAVNLLNEFQQTYPSNHAFKNYDVGPRYTRRMLKSFAVKLFNAL
jgi:hypothetical protein